MNSRLRVPLTIVGLLIAIALFSPRDILLTDKNTPDSTNFDNTASGDNASDTYGQIEYPDGTYSINLKTKNRIIANTKGREAKDRFAVIDEDELSEGALLFACLVASGDGSSNNKDKAIIINTLMTTGIATNKSMARTMAKGLMKTASENQACQ